MASLRSTRSLGISVCALFLLSALPSDAAACGGCFNPPTPTGMPTPVTGHRMAVSLSTSGTTLWDQIQYAGNPEDFVWVLPVMGTPMVELADNGFFEALAQVTEITLTAPAPPRTVCPSSGGGGFACGASASSRSGTCPGGGLPPCILLADAGGVAVHFEGVVGPYETATVGSSDPMALVTWLQDRGYGVPDDILPIIAHYTTMGANFAVLRLAPTAGVDRMQPVRVTSPGLSLSFPLRMVAAGVQTSVDLELFVFAESRMEAGNFARAEVDRDAITYDWASNRFSYDDEYDAALFSGTAGTNWVTEFAGLAPIATIAAFTSFSGDETHRAAVDMAVVTDGIELPYLTRMRTTLPPSELDRDLILRSSTGFDIGTSISVTRELNRAPDVDCGGGGGACEVARGRNEDVVVLTFVLAPALLTWRRRRPLA